MTERWNVGALLCNMGGLQSNCLKYLETFGARFSLRCGYGSISDQNHHAAVMQAQTPGALWAVDRSTFRNIIVDSMIRRREHHEELLSNMPIFSPLTAENRAAIADCLVQETYEVRLTGLGHYQITTILEHALC